MHITCVFVAGLFASKTVLVPSSVQSYDEKVAADLWDLSADTAKLSRQPITQWSEAAHYIWPCRSLRQSNMQMLTAFIHANGHSTEDAQHACHATFLAKRTTHEISCALLLLWFVHICSSIYDAATHHYLLKCVYLSCNYYIADLPQPCLQQHVLGLTDPWQHSVDYTAAVCSNTYTLALANRHMPALHAQTNNLQFPSTRDGL